MNKDELFDEVTGFLLFVGTFFRNVWISVPNGVGSGLVD